MASTHPMETVTSADGTEIAFERTGSGPPLVLVPGGGANDHTRWDAGGVRPAFADHRTVYAIDGRGLGESGDAAEYDLEREFEDVAVYVPPRIIRRVVNPTDDVWGIVINFVGSGPPTVDEPEPVDNRRYHVVPPSSEFNRGSMIYR